MKMEIIVFISLLILYAGVEIFRESQQKKWYRRGYLDACSKYDKEDYRNSPHENEADESFDKQYGFKYD